MGNNEILIKKEWAVNADLLYCKADNKTKSKNNNIGIKKYNNRSLSAANS